MRTSLYDYCLERGRTDLLQQWDGEENGPLTPQTVSYGSKRKAAWICGRGHRWRTEICVRTGAGSGCPYCAGKKVSAGENDLATQYPSLAAQWHPTKNGDVTPADVSAGSHRRAWWVCGRGHQWQAAVKTRVSGAGCPVCANRRLIAGENDLAATHPALAAQWNPTRNGALTPEQLGAGTRKKVWWQCEKGHQWQASVASRAAGAGCPVCAGKRVIPGENDLATHFPDIAAQWHPEKNEGLLPSQVSPSSNRKVWWRCQLGHEYTAVIAARTTHSSGCPYCAGRKALAGFNDLATLEPEVAAQWHPRLNGALTPEQVTVGAHRKVWWECPCGHIWKAVVYSRAGPQKSGCPVCAGRLSPERIRRYQAMDAAQAHSKSCV